MPELGDDELELEFEKAVVEILPDTISNDEQGRTYAKLLAQSVLRSAITGDMRAANRILDAVEKHKKRCRKVPEPTEPPSCGSKEANRLRIRELLSGAIRNLSASKS